jgi:hypothetical protein
MTLDYRELRPKNRVESSHLHLKNFERPGMQYEVCPYRSLSDNPQSRSGSNWWAPSRQFGNRDMMREEWATRLSFTLLSVSMVTRDRSLSTSFPVCGTRYSRLTQAERLKCCEL